MKEERIILPAAFLEKLQEAKAVLAISGKSGCGNTTVTTMLARSLGLEMVNYTFRTMAAEEGVPMQTIIERARTNPEVDRHVDRRQAELASRGRCVLGSRLAIWMATNAHLKVYLYADVEVRAARIQKREGGTFEEVLEATRVRDQADRQRYLDLYGIDNDDPGPAHLVIDSGVLSPSKIVMKIVDELAETLGLTEYLRT